MVRSIGQVVETLHRSPASEQKNWLPNAEIDQRQQQAVLHTAVLLGGFRKCDASDPEIYSRTIEHVLARYDVDIQRQASDASRYQFPPTAFELREACEAIAREKQRARERQAGIAKQLAERRALDSTRERPLAHPGPPRAPGETKADRERRAAQAFLDRSLAEAQMANAAAASRNSSVYDIDPDEWRRGE